MGTQIYTLSKSDRNNPDNLKLSVLTQKRVLKLQDIFM
ncbi:hypothetical protein NSTC731_03389 [Nostoc sp. DSM 114167]